MSRATAGDGEWESSTMTAAPSGSLGGIVGDDAMTSADIRPSTVVSRLTASVPESRRYRVHWLDEPGPEPDQVTVRPVAGQPGREAGGLAAVQSASSTVFTRACRAHDDGQPSVRARRQLVMQPGPGDQRAGNA